MTKTVQVSYINKSGQGYKSFLENSAWFKVAEYSVDGW